MTVRCEIWITIALVVLISACPAVGQARSELPEVQDLREKIQRLESMSVDAMAPSMLRIYERTLLGFYEQLLPFLQQEIDGGSEAAHVRDTLRQEKARLINNITVLKMSLGTSDIASTPLSNTTSPATEAPVTTTNIANSSRAALPPPPVNLANPTTSTPSTTTASTTATPVSTSAPAATNAPSALASAPACEYKNVPPILKDEAQKLAGSILFNSGTPAEKAQEVGSDDYKLVFYTIADALNLQVTTALPSDPSKSKTITFRELEPYHYLGETVRTDKQLGASASSSAAVSRVDKAGFAWLLGLGIENGLVEKNVRDSVLTLSSSPAALYMLKKDTSNPYQSAGLLNRIGVSASFNISNQDQLLANATRSQLREYSVKFRFVGDRSPRSPKLEKIWDDVAGNIQQRLIAINNASQFMSTDPFMRPLVDKTRAELETAVVSLITSDDFKKDAGTNGAVTQKQVDTLAGTILCYLSTNVLSQKDRVSPAAVAQFKEVLVPNLVSAQLKLQVVREEFERKIDEFFKGSLGTIAYINRREPILGNYSEFKLLYEHPTTFLLPLAIQKLTANAGFSFYHQPNTALKQERLRGMNGALSFEGSMANPFAETADLGRITYSFVGRYDRLFENSRIKGRKADLASFQFLMDFPLFKGFAFPFSLTYSNATETERKQGWRANFGFKLDTDKLLELVRAASAR